MSTQHTERATARVRSGKAPNPRDVRHPDRETRGPIIWAPGTPRAFSGDYPDQIECPRLRRGHAEDRGEGVDVRTATDNNQLARRRVRHPSTAVGTHFISYGSGVRQDVWRAAGVTLACSANKIHSRPLRTGAADIGRLLTGAGAISHLCRNDDPGSVVRPSKEGTNLTMVGQWPTTRA